MDSRTSADPNVDPSGTRRSQSPGVVIGNYCHKYTTSNPLIRWLTRRFLDDLDAVLASVATQVESPRVLEVGCGEGEISRRLHARWEDVVALDLPDPGLRESWSEVPGPRFIHADAERLPFEEGGYDVVVCVEVLEHLSDPAAGLSELARVARGGHLVLSVPREPLFRMGNFLTGRHLAAFGNTPGHLNHWSSRGFLEFVESAGEVRSMKKPFPWTIVWAESAA